MIFLMILLQYRNMLKIRLQRTGRINLPSFRLIVTEHTEGPKTGNFVDKVGTYNPRTKERKIDEVRIKHWMSVGAKPSATVHNMLVSLGIINAKKINILPQYKAPEVAAAEEKQEEVEKAAEQEAKAEAKEAFEAEVQAQTAEKETPETPPDEPKEEEAPAGEAGAEEKPAA